MLNKNVLNNLYSNIKELSSTELQISYWLKGDQGSVSSFVELYNKLFDDDDLDLFIDEEVFKLNLSDSFIRSLQKLRTMLNKYDERNLDQEQIIHDKGWLEICNHAKEVINFWDAELSSR